MVRPIVARAVSDILVVYSDDAVGDIRARDDRLTRIRPGFSAWPSDGQLGLHVLAWLLGPGFRDPALDAALCEGMVPDFHRAAEAAVNLRNGGHPGVVGLHGIAAHALRNAGRVLHWNAPPETLYYPMVLP